jgi:hypothetical protein
MRTILKTTILLLTAVTMTVALNTAMAHECDDQDLIDAAGVGITGSADLCMDSSGPSARLHAEGLVPGDAYTVWWIYIDDPSQCDAGPGDCGMADFGGDNPLGVFGRFGSVVAPNSGKTHIFSRFRGMKPSSGSQIWILMINHGEASSDGRQLARQLLTPEDPAAGAPHLGVEGGPVGATVALTVHVME